jgi:plastocyanin
MVAGLAFVVAACGGEKKAEDQTAAPGQQAAPAESAPAANAPAANAPAGTGKTHDVNMVLDGSKYKYDPDNLTIGPSDVIRFHNKSGGPHNVSFYEDSIPKGAASHIVLPDPMTPLASKLAVAPDEVLEVKFNDAPKGEYKFFCTPHAALFMKGKLTVQ